MRRDIERLDTEMRAVVSAVIDAGGEIPMKDVMRLASRSLGVSIGRMPFVVNSAIAESLLVADRRRGVLTLPVN